MRRRWWLLFLTPLLAAAAGCPRSAGPGDSKPAEPPWLEDVTAKVGLNFVHDAGPIDDRFFLPQITGSGAAAFDFDGDGRLDLVVNNFNDRAYYFRNRFPKKNHVAFRLTGTVSNRDAVGALVTLHIGKELMVRQVHAAGGYLSQSSLTVHFGLGDRAKVDRAVIRWPRGRVQEIEAPAINRLHRLTEPKD